MEKSDIAHDVVFYLHDTTPHPETWKHEKDYIESLGIHMTEDGFIAAPLEKHVDITYRGTSTKLADAITNFRPKIYPKIPFESGIDNSEGWSKNDIYVEYYPVMLDKWSNKLKKLSTTNGMNFLLKLLHHVRENYP